MNGVYDEKLKENNTEKYIIFFRLRFELYLKENLKLLFIIKLYSFENSLILLKIHYIMKIAYGLKSMKFIYFDFNLNNP